MEILFFQYINHIFPIFFLRLLVLIPAPSVSTHIGTLVYFLIDQYFASVYSNLRVRDLFSKGIPFPLLFKNFLFNVLGLKCEYLDFFV